MEPVPMSQTDGTAYSVCSLGLNSVTVSDYSGGSSLESGTNDGRGEQGSYSGHTGAAVFQHEGCRKLKG